MASLEEEIERIGELLIEEGLVLQDEIDEALKDPAVRNGPIASALHDLVCVRRNELAAFVGTDYHFPQPKEIGALKPPVEILETISAESAVKLNALPVARVGPVLFVLVSDPSVETVRELRKLTGARIKLMLGPAEKVRKAVQDLYLRQPISVTANEPEVATSEREEEEAVTTAPAEEAPPKRATSTLPSVAPAVAEQRGVRLQATRIPMEEYRESEQYQIFMRTIIDWEGNYVVGRPVHAIRIA
jgi:hypothetical protein